MLRFDQSLDPASIQFKNTLLDAFPNNGGLRIPEYLKLAAEHFGIRYEPLLRYWRNNTSKSLSASDLNKIRDAAYEAHLLREIKLLQLKQKYLSNLISGEIKKHEEETAFINRTAANPIRGSFA